MSQFGHIVRKEVLLHLREARFIWVAGLLCGLVVLSFLLMGADYAERVDQYLESVAEGRRDVLDADASVSVLGQVRRLVNDKGVFAFRPPKPLSVMASGLEEMSPRHVHVSDRQNWSRQASEAFYSNPLSKLFPRPDFASVVASVLSLVGLFFAFDAVCGEKAGGTLRLAMSASVGRPSVLLAKWAGALLIAGVPFVASAATGAVLYATGTGLDLSLENLVRMIAIVLLAAVYLSLFVTMGLLVSTLVKRPAAALLICLAAWVGLTVVVPNLAASAGSLLAPTASIQEVQLKKRGINREWSEAAAGLRRQVRAGTLTEEDRQRQQEVLRAKAEEERLRLDEAYLAELGVQVQTSTLLARLSPASCLTFGAVNLADTGLAHYKAVHEGFKRYRTQFAEYAGRLKREAGDDRLTGDWAIQNPPPELVVAKADLETSLDAVVIDVCILALWQVILFAAAYVRFLRYDVR